MELHTILAKVHVSYMSTLSLTTGNQHIYLVHLSKKGTLSLFDFQKATQFSY
jgi:hypothetical protein